MTALDSMAAVQSRINEIQARFAPPAPAGFGDVLASRMGGLRTATSYTGAAVPGRVPDGLSPAVDVAQRYLGTPYVWGGESPGGFDCSGLVQYVYGQLGVDLPRTAADQAKVGQAVPSLADACPGDLLAFHDPVDHIGIYAGNGLMVVAPKTGDVVKVQSVYDQPTAIRRILPGPAAGPATTYGADLVTQRSVLLSVLPSLLGGAS
ncbi:MAG TPA: C40 family peptidase [Acidimicrobiia bacterium]|nr:C40 family peptidase [Acidimicrobiia bacterium]